jgi:hypothetical protein
MTAPMLWANLQAICCTIRTTPWRITTGSWPSFRPWVLPMRGG